MTNATETVSGYFTVWSCAVAALIAALVLLRMPKQATERPITDA